MLYSQPARSTRQIRIRRTRVFGLLVVVAAIAVALGQRLPASSPSSAAPSAAAPRAAPRTGHRGPRGGHPGLPPSEQRGVVGEAGGAVPAGTTVFDEGVPGVARLAPALLDALREAATIAAGDGVQLMVDSGWRSQAYQQQLRREAVSRYGSEAEAARWVAPADRSPHVSGDAVDIGPVAAATWLSAHGAAYGLCQIYANEPWHYELRPEAIAHGCPPMYADPTHDPRMQQ